MGHVIMISEIVVDNGMIYMICSQQMLQGPGSFVLGSFNVIDFYGRDADPWAGRFTA